jgi:hypothetical protein
MHCAKKYAWIRLAKVTWGKMKCGERFVLWSTVNQWESLNLIAIGWSINGSKLTAPDKLNEVSSVGMSAMCNQHIVCVLFWTSKWLGSWHKAIEMALLHPLQPLRAILIIMLLVEVESGKAQQHTLASMRHTYIDDVWWHWKRMEKQTKNLSRDEWWCHHDV